MEIQIKVSDEERYACLCALKKLNEHRTIRNMSQAIIAETSGIKATKLRVVLQELIQKGLTVRYQATENAKLQRYYYVVTDAGDAFCSQFADRSKN